MHAQQQSVRPSSANGFINFSWVLDAQASGSLDRILWEYKRDGDRRALVIDGPTRAFYGKRDSVGGGLVDKIQQVPQFGRLLSTPERLPLFALDGEAYLPGKTHADLTSVIGCAPELAWERQGMLGQHLPINRQRFVHYEVFNQILHKGKSIRHRPYRERRAIADATVATLVATNPYLKDLLTTSMQFTCPSAQAAKTLFRQSLELGHEGLMAKDPGAIDGEGLWKWKVYRDTCVLITGMTQGKGKYAGQIGAVQGSVRRDGQLIEVTQTSGVDDAFRAQLSKARGTWRGLVAEVRGQGLDVHGRIRHPRWRFLRPQVDPQSCTWEKFQLDMTDTTVLP